MVGFCNCKNVELSHQRQGSTVQSDRIKQLCSLLDERQHSKKGLSQTSESAIASICKCGLMKIVVADFSCRCQHCCLGQWLVAWLADCCWLESRFLQKNFNLGRWDDWGQTVQQPVFDTSGHDRENEESFQSCWFFLSRLEVYIHLGWVRTYAPPHLGQLVHLGLVLCLGK